MGKFNFESYQKEQQEKQLKFGGFKPIKPGGFGAGKRDSRALVTISRNGIAPNASATEQLVEFGRYVEFMIQGEFLIMRFLELKSDFSYKMSATKSGVYSGATNIAAKKVLNELQENTDFINLNLYRYKFLLNKDEDNIFYIDLKKPDDKKRIR